MAHQMSIDAATRRSVEMFLDRIGNDFSIAEAWLFGSRARGDARTDSDADVAVILSGPKRRTVDAALAMAGPEFDVMLETGVLVSAIPIALEEWRNPIRHGNPFLIGNIRREGIRI